jgi:hypothetical protein
VGLVSKRSVLHLKEYKFVNRHDLYISLVFIVACPAPETDGRYEEP